MRYSRRTIISIGSYLLFFSSPLLAKKGSSFSGTIVDNNFVKKNKKGIKNKLKKYTKKMALQKKARQSGYSIVTQKGKIWKLSDKETKKIIDYLSLKKNSLKVRFNASKKDGKLVLTSPITNRNKKGSGGKKKKGKGKKR